MRWANFLHIYQPPTQNPDITEKVTGESYRVLIRILKEHPEAKITLNINACLTEQLELFGLVDVIDGLEYLARNGQIEFTGSAKYHPILPLIPRKEMIRQIRLNEESNRELIGSIYKPGGFFPPEMCYSREVAEVVKELGYRWVIIDELCYSGKLGEVKYDRMYQLKGLDEFHVFFKERPYSAGISFGRYPDSRPFLSDLKEKIEENSYLLTGTDGEVYGHHRKGQEKLLEEIYSSKVLPTTTISELFKHFPERDFADPRSGSWSTWEDELASGIPYPQWQYPGNPVHELQWKLVSKVLDLWYAEQEKLMGNERARTALDEGLYSCQFWWASMRPWWDTGMIFSGADKLLEAIRYMEPLAGEQKECREMVSAIKDSAKKLQDDGTAMKNKLAYMEKYEMKDLLTFG